MKVVDLFKRINVLHLILFSGLVFIAYLLLISFYLRPATDDYCVNYFEIKYGLFGTLQMYYYTWSARFASWFTHVWMERIYGNMGNYILLHIILIVVQLSVNYFLIKKVLRSSVSVPVTFTVSLFLFIFSILPQSDFAYFYWIPSISCYFLNFTFFQILIIAIFFVKRKVIWFPLIVVSTFYSFTSNENFACSNLFILFVLFIFFIKSEFKNKLVIAFLLGFSGILFMYFSPATAIRQNAFPAHTILQTLISWPKEFYSFWFWIFPKTAVYYFILIPVMLYMGFISGFSAWKKENVLKYIGIGTAFTFILLLLSIFPNVYAMGKIGPPRAYTNLYYYITVYLSVVSFLTGSLIKNDYRILGFVAGFSACLLLVNSLDYIRINIPELKKYAISYDNRIRLINENIIRGDKVLILPKLYQLEAKPYPIYSDIIAADSTGEFYWVNECMQNSMGLDFKIYEEK